ncbi:uncharacterized protein LOC111692418 [Anoplophora glabripennis]|uniref:uncharacterized protein LOC108912089 n=1 Tax=Anoplophora glabripennis TaxID=217634 RepID=UPI000C769018|nr:uncharacterized protein LOC108912089 [Anoplophora glabripennis]XP_023312195.1 uncharacterized protein LOC111692418 [Anoplophora glabripennis]
MARLGFVNWDLLRKLAAMEQEEAWGIQREDDVSDNESEVDELVESDAEGEEYDIDGVNEEEEEEEYDEGQADECGNGEADAEPADDVEEVPDYVDEGVVEDCSDEHGAILMRSHEVVNGDVADKGQLYCYTYSMVLVSTDPKGDYELCHRCYMELVRLSDVEEYEHRHYDSHTTGTYEECSFYCSSCRLPLEQVRLTRTCVICNNTRPQKDSVSD